MPYIPQEERDALDPAVAVLARCLADHTSEMETADCSGRLNYVITTLLVKYIRIRFSKISYSVGQMARNTLCDVRDEFYRRVMVPYEDRKSKENGDVNYEEIL